MIIGTKKCVVIGTGNVGKSSMLISYISKAFPDPYVPLVLEDCSHKITVRGDDHILETWDTGGGEDYDRFRPLGYAQTDVFLICFKVTWPESFEDIRRKWVPEIQHYCPGVPLVIVGTQIDLRDDPQVLDPQTAITTEQGKRLAQQLGAAQYVECSALTREGLDAVFEEAVLATLKCPVAPSNRDSKCVVA
ncbi:cell division control protein 42 [Mycena filopes]|nr:cell division control protein 42 [Mycena filopes]